MKNKTKFTIITKSLIILFGISALLFTQIISIKFFNASGGQKVYMDFRFGYLFGPSEILFELGGSFNTIFHKTFTIIFIVGYLLNFGYILNFGYFKKEKISKLRSKLNLVSVVLMLIGLFGCIIYAIETTHLDLSFYDEINYVYTSIEMLDGFYLGIFVIHLVLIEYIVLEKTNLLTDKGPIEIKTITPQTQTVAEEFKYCSQCGEKITEITNSYCSNCGNKWQKS